MIKVLRSKYWIVKMGLTKIIKYLKLLPLAYKEVSCMEPQYIVLRL